MDIDTYFSSVVAGFEFLIALGSERGNIKKLTRRHVKPAKSRREAQW
jgi:hypothetical protein